MENFKILDLKEINVGPLKASMSLHVNGGLVIRDFRIVEEEGLLMVVPPQKRERAKGGEVVYHNIVEFPEESTWERVQAKILGYYYSHRQKEEVEIKCRVMPYTVFQTSLYVLGFHWYLQKNNQRIALANMQVLEAVCKDRVGLFFLMEDGLKRENLLNKHIGEASKIVDCDELYRFDELSPEELKSILGWEFKMSNLDEVSEVLWDEVFNYFNLDRKFRG